MAVDCRSNRAGQFIVDLRVACHRRDLFLVLLRYRGQGKAGRRWATALACLALDTESTDVRLVHALVTLARCSSSAHLLCDDSQNSDHLNSIAWRDFVGELSVDSNYESSWHLSSWDHLRRLLQLERLLVEEFAFLGDDAVRVEWTATALLSKWGSGVGALTSSLGTAKSKLDLLSVGVVARGALPSDLSGFDARAASRCDYAWHDDHFSDHVAGQFSEVLRVLITVDLHLPVRNFTSGRLRLGNGVIVVVIYLLGGRLENGNHCLRVVAHHLG